MSDPINEMFPMGGGMRGEPALVCVTYDSNGDPCGISGLPDFAESYVKALSAERDRLAAENARLWEYYQAAQAIDAIAAKWRQRKAGIGGLLDGPNIFNLTDKLTTAEARLYSAKLALSADLVARFGVIMKGYNND